MAKSSNNWFDALQDAKIASKGKLPYFVSCEENVWHDIIVDPATMNVCDDGGKDGEWSCIRLKVGVPERDDMYEEEIPFWAMEGFMDCLSGADGEQEIIGILFKRVKSGVKNHAYWKLPQ